MKIEIHDFIQENGCQMISCRGTINLAFTKERLYGMMLKVTLEKAYIKCLNKIYENSNR